jgi:translocation and assembly module TamA
MKKAALLHFYKIITASLLIFFLLNKPCQAFNMPFLNKKVHLIFEDKKYQERLEGVIEESLKQAEQDRKNQKINLSSEQIALLTKNLIEKVLHSQGFYDGVVYYKSSDLDIYKINPKSPYVIKKVVVNSNSKNIKLPLAEKITEESGLKKGKVLIAKNVFTAQEKLKEYVEETYCLWSVEIGYKAIIDRKNKKIEIIFSLKPSPSAKFGEVNIEGLTSLEESYIKNKIKIEENSCFKKIAIDKVKLDLLKTGLFADVSSSLSKNNKNIVNIKFKLKERHHKTIKAGLAFSSDEGLIPSAGWEHRNILGKAQNLQIDARASRLSQVIESSLTIPSFFNDRQQLTIRETLSRKNFRAFDSKSSETSVTLERKLTNHLAAGVGAGLRVTHIKEDFTKEDFKLLSLPLTLKYDTRNKDFNPDKGLFISGKLAPNIDIGNNNEYFTKSTAVGTYYYKLKKRLLNPVFAFKLAGGSINHINILKAPADEKFYVGGGNSIRGYGFQKAGLLIDGSPTGALSFIETSVESRLRFSKSWGGALFIDGGNSFEQTTPNLTQNLKWAGGFGVRYFTGFMPVRLDVAFPFDRRNNVDDSFQFYIGIGQAF